MKRALVLIGLTVLATAWGCAFDPVTENPSPIEGDSFRDVPKPREFELVKEGRQSFKYENGEFKRGLLKYEGNESARELVTFYQSQMPIYGWQVRTAAPDRKDSEEIDTILPSDLGERRDLYFSKGRYLAQVAVGELPTDPDKPKRAVVAVLLKTN